MLLYKAHDMPEKDQGLLALPSFILFVSAAADVSELCVGQPVPFWHYLA